MAIKSSRKIANLQPQEKELLLEEAKKIAKLKHPGIVTVFDILEFKDTFLFVSELLEGGEFGRTPTAETGKGRDHHARGFNMWMAGGGIRGGTIHGATEKFGYHAVENKVSVSDLHATILHLLGLDHKKLTYCFMGLDMLLTDVSGEVIKPILA